MENKEQIALKALNCLEIEVDISIANDIRQKIIEAFDEIRLNTWNSAVDKCAETAKAKEMSITNSQNSTPIYGTFIDKQSILKNKIWK